MDLKDFFFFASCRCSKICQGYPISSIKYLYTSNGAFHSLIEIYSLFKDLPTSTLVHSDRWI